MRRVGRVVVACSVVAGAMFGMGGVAQAAACAPLSASVTREDLFWNPLFNNYGNDNTFDTANLTAPLNTPVRFDPFDLGHGPIFWGVSVLQQGSYTYIWGESTETVNGFGGSHAYLARVPVGDLHNPWQWRFWSGSAWTAAGRQDLAQPVIPFTGAGDQETGVAHGFSIVARLADLLANPKSGVEAHAEVVGGGLQRLELGVVRSEAALVAGAGGRVVLAGAPEDGATYQP